MKSAIGGALMVIGLLVLVGSAFIGEKVADDEEWTEEKQEEFSQISVSVHNPRNREVSQQQVDRLKEMQQELIDAKSSRDSSRRTMKIAGFSSVIVGLCFQFWAWASQNKE